MNSNKGTRTTANNHIKLTGCNALMLNIVDFYKKKFFPFFWVCIAFYVFSLCFDDSAWPTDIYLSEHLKINPEIIIREVFSDNIYLVNDEKTDEYITSVLPNINMQIAFTPRSRVEILYLGQFDFYKNTDNFKKDHHYGHANLQLESNKGSTFEIGAWGGDSANQPNTDIDTSKDYTIGAFYADANLKVLSATELFGTGQHSFRNFDDENNSRDDFDLDFLALGLVNSHSANFPLLVEYRYAQQENAEAIPIPTELSYQSAFTGFRWREDQRLSGNLRVGYLWSDYNGSQAYDGWAADTDLTYRIGPYTDGVLSLERGIQRSTRSARDTLDYYIYAGAGLSLKYTRLDPLMITLSCDFENRDYRSAVFSTDEREDDLYNAVLTASYRFRDWLSFSLGYRYRMNDSNIDPLDYTENRVFAEIILFSTGEVRRRRLPKSVGQIRYF